MPCGLLLLLFWMSRWLKHIFCTHAMIDLLTALQVNKYIAMAQKKLLHKVYSIRLDANRGHHRLTGLDRIVIWSVLCLYWVLRARLQRGGTF